MEKLSEIMTKPGNRDRVIRDCVEVVNQEVDAKSGFSGMAIKAGFAVVKRLESGRMIYKAVDSLIDEFIDQLQPFFDRYRGEGSPGTFDAYLRARIPEVSNALLEVTDKRERGARHKLLKKTYNKLRPTAKRNVEQAIPRVSRLMQRHIDEAKRDG